MSRAVGMVDAGFLRPSIERAIGVSVDTFDIDPVDLTLWLNHASRRVNRSFLRCYWYDAIWDAADSRYSAQKRKFNELDGVSGVQVRLGHLKKKPEPWKSKLFRTLREMEVDVDEVKRRFDFSDVMEQKGVDTLLVLDMVRLAQQGAFDVLFLIAGDGDLAEAARTVQELGKEVILVHPVGAGVSPELARVADERVEMGELQLRRLLSTKPGIETQEGETEGAAESSV